MQHIPLDLTDLTSLNATDSQPDTNCLDAAALNAGITLNKPPRKTNRTPTRRPNDPPSANDSEPAPTCITRRRHAGHTTAAGACRQAHNTRASDSVRCVLRRSPVRSVQHTHPQAAPPTTRATRHSSPRVSTPCPIGYAEVCSRCSPSIASRYPSIPNPTTMPAAAGDRNE